MFTYEEAILLLFRGEAKLNGVQEVAGSNPAGPICKIGGVLLHV